MAKVPGFVKAFAGLWRIVGMDAWRMARSPSRRPLPEGYLAAGPLSHACR